MPSTLTTDVGATLVLRNRGQFVTGMEAAADATKTLKDELIELEAAAGKASAALDDTALSESVGAKAAADSAKSSQVAADAAIIASQKLQTERTKESVVTDAASESATKYEGVLAGLANSNFTKKFALFGGSALAVGAYEGIKAYSQFQSQMMQTVTLAGVPLKELGGIMTYTEALSRKSGISMSNLADQAYRLASANAGMKGTAATLERMQSASANMSILLGLKSPSDYDQASRIFGAIMNTARGSQGNVTGIGTNYNKIGAMVSAAVGAGDIKGTEITGALGRGVLQAEEAAGLKLPDILTGIALGTRFAANPSTTGTLLSHFMQQFASPSEQGAKVEAMLGFGSQELGNIAQKKGLFAAVNDLTTRMRKGLAFGSTALNNYPAFETNAPGPSSAYAQLVAYGMGTNPALLQAMVSGHGSKELQNDLFRFITTKAFGGARQGLPFLTSALNPKMAADIEKYIIAQSTPAAGARRLAETESTPAWKQAHAINEMRVTLLDLGRDATPFYTKGLQVLGDLANWLGNNPTILKAILAIGASLVGLSTGAIVLNKLSKVFFGGASKLFGFGAQTALPNMLALNTSATEENTAALLKTRLGGGGGVGTGGGGVVRDAEGAAEKDGGEVVTGGVISTWLKKNMSKIFTDSETGGLELTARGAAMGATASLAAIYELAHGGVKLQNWAAARDPQGNIAEALWDSLIGKPGFSNSISFNTVNRLPKGSQDWSTDRKYKWYLEHNKEASNGLNNHHATKQSADVSKAINDLDNILYHGIPGETKTKTGKSLAEVLDHLDNHVSTFSQVLQQIQQHGLTAVVSGQTITKVVQQNQASNFARGPGAVGPAPVV